MDVEFAGTILDRSPKEKSICKFCKKLVFHMPSKCWKNPGVKSKGYSKGSKSDKKKGRSQELTVPCLKSKL